MAKRMATKAEREWMSRVAELGCIIGNEDCGGRLEIHHLTGRGMGLRASHFSVLPLCNFHHSAQSPLGFGNSVHNGTKTFEKKYGTQEYLLFQVKQKLGAVD